MAIPLNGLKGDEFDAVMNYPLSGVYLTFG